jgi:arabinose-5-phosphate isomerase
MDHPDILEIARQVLEQEAEALIAAKNRLDQRLLTAVDLILTARGRLIVSGMGKSGLVGRKISATLSSTGTPSFFLHPAEALHGDLGMITDADVLLMLSNSGETKEIIQLIPFIRRIGARIIALSGDANASLAKMADVTIDAAVEREACPLNLAPTSSTTVALALGDALAVALLKARGFREKDFARLHPSGNLGRKFLKVADLMHTGPTVPTSLPDISLKQAISLISKGSFGTIIITASDETLLGIVTDGDLRRYFERTDGRLDIPVTAMMTTNPKTIASDRLVMEALKIMEDKAITSLAVVDSGKVRGFLHLHDILKSRIV